MKQILQNNLETAKNDLKSKSVSLKSVESNIKELKKEKDTLNARLNQIQSSTSNTANRKRPNTSHSSNTATPTKKTKKDKANVYEVEQLIDHKMKARKILYKVRWKSYDSDDDTWESESDLQCPDILKEYKKKQKME